MHSFTILFAILVALSAVTSKQIARRSDELADLPSCGLECLKKAANNKKLMGKCSLSDYKCLCNNESFELSSRKCVVAACSDSDKLKMIAFEDEQCPGQNLRSLPDCGQLCLFRASTNKKLIGKCAASDTACLCENKAYSGNVRQCVLSTCGFQDELAMLSWSNKTCPK
jgi:hypothetical protein